MCTVLLPPGDNPIAVDKYINISILGRSVRTMKENAEALKVAGKEIGLEVNADKTKYMIMSQDQNAGQLHNMMNGKSFERVEEFKYLETT